MPRALGSAPRNDTDFVRGGRLVGQELGRDDIGTDAQEREAGRQAVPATGGARRGWLRRNLERTPGFLALVGAGVLLGSTVIFWIVGWGGVRDVGGGCGGGGTPCPKGATTLILLGFAGMFGGVIIAIAGFAAFKPRQVGAVVLAVAAVLGAFGPARWTADVLTGGQIAVAWRSPAERTETPGALGVWAHAGGAVRVRADGAAAYDPAGKRVAWTYTLPGAEAVCGMSRTPDGGIGVLMHAAADRGCGAVTALDLATGRALWTYQVPGNPRGPASGPGPDRVAITNGLVALVEDGAVRAMDARTGAPRWQVPAAERGQSSMEVAAGPGRFVVVTGPGAEATVGPGAPGVRSLDAATGATAWSAPLPRDPATVADVDILATAPVTLWVEGPAPRPMPEITSYDDTGRRRATIPAVGPVETLQREAHPAFTAQTPRHVVVVGDTLVAAAKRGTASEPDRVSAYALADGRPLWSTRVGKPLMAVAAAPNGVLAAAGGTPRLRLLDPASGRIVADGSAKAAKPNAYHTDGYEAFQLPNGDWLLALRANSAGGRGVLVLR